MKKLKKKRVATKKSKKSTEPRKRTPAADQEKPPWQRESTPREIGKGNVSSGGKPMRQQKHQAR
jgi:hypothetical protein